MKTTLDKIESFINTSSYKELVESANSFNIRMSVERRMRLPFLDSQTGMAQNHSSLFMNKRQRMPGMVPGQIYTYPRQRWRKKRRQYLLMNSRSFARAADASFHLLDTGDGDIHNISAVENPALQDTDSKDSQMLLKDDMSKEWFYDEQDMLEMDDYDVPDQDSDLDYEESYSKRSRRRRGPGRGRGGISESPGTPGRRRGVGRGRRKAIPLPTTSHFDSVNGDGDKPFACERTPGRRGRPNNPNNNASSSNAPPTLPPNPPATTSSPSATTDDPPMPVLLPESIDSVSTESSAPTLESSAPAPPLTDSATTIAPPASPGDDSDAPALVPSAAATALANKERAPPSPYCDFCLGDSRENKKTGGSEELVSCSDCGRSGHPTCLQFTNNMMVSVKKYRWQCIECKCCSLCGTSDNDDQLLFCDDCDRGYHMYCLIPSLNAPPEGSWSCKLCIREFHKK